nr:FAD-dependent oxygenase [Micromonospora sp. DSM 115978]
MQFPPTDDVPEPLRGGAFVLVEAVFMGGEQEGARLLEPLRRLDPAVDTFAAQPPAGIAELHMDPPQPLPYQADHLVLADLDGPAVDRLVAAVGPGSGSELISVELRHLGGALSRSAV